MRAGTNLVLYGVISAHWGQILGHGCLSLIVGIEGEFKVIYNRASSRSGLLIDRTPIGLQVIDIKIY